jgi:hypothetical protein
MPYIKQEDRKKFNEIDLPYIENAGELNYLITTICQSYICEKGLNYAHINEVIGALECAKLELYRRVASPYEDKKILENGDVNCLSS